MKNQKIKLFTHTDLDGIGCSILFKKVYGSENVDVEYCDYNNVNLKIQNFLEDLNNLQKFDHVCITDISVSEEIANKIELINKQKDFISPSYYISLLDHHPTALFLNKYKWCIVREFKYDSDIKTSGTDMLYESFVATYRFILFEQKIENLTELEELDMSVLNCKNFVEVIRQYDTWDWKKLNNNLPKQWNDLLYILGRDRFIEMVLNNNLSTQIPKEYELLLQLEQEKIDRYIKTKDKEIIRKQLLNYNVGIVFAEQFHSELGNQLCIMNNDLDFIIIINPSKATSYRSVGNKIDLGKDVASVFGGGGHPNASGSPITDEMREEIIKIIFKL